MWPSAGPVMSAKSDKNLLTTVVTSEFQVPLPLVLFTLLTMITLILLAIYKEPITIGAGVALFLMGAPLYYLTRWLSQRKCVDRAMGRHSETCL